MYVIVEITRDNNGSLSDSSFDVESEENFDRRRGLSGSMPGVGGTPSSTARMANHHHGRSSGGRHYSASGRHGPGEPALPQGSGSGGRRAPSSEGHRSSRSHAAADNSGTTGQQSGSRLFVALFDYDPATMSPNPNAVNDELPFREGQVIKVSSVYLLIYLFICLKSNSHAVIQGMLFTNALSLNVYLFSRTCQ